LTWSGSSETRRLVHKEAREDDTHGKIEKTNSKRERINQNILSSMRILSFLIE